MRRKLIAIPVLALALTGVTSGTALAKSENGKGNGNVGCTLSDRSHYDNPADMLKFLAERDGSFQETVDKYSFDSVGDLIGQKCGG